MKITPINPELLKVCEIELVYKSKIKASDRIKIASALQASNVFMSSWDNDKIDFIEQFKLLLLNRAKRVLGIVEISSGGMGSTVVDIRLIFIAALKSGANSIILGHNHPSGNLKPSQSDIAITEKVRSAGKLMDIELNDHIIITSGGYY